MSGFWGARPRRFRSSTEADTTAAFAMLQWLGAAYLVWIGNTHAANRARRIGHISVPRCPAGWQRDPIRCDFIAAFSARAARCSIRTFRCACTSGGWVSSRRFESSGPLHRDDYRGGPVFFSAGKRGRSHERRDAEREQRQLHHARTDCHPQHG
jgi:hypothetical protein